jgi:large subunit ribosomal protein L9
VFDAGDQKSARDRPAALRDTLKVILLKEVERLGKAYDIVTTKDGYARNYLFPHNLAIPATPANIKGLEKTKKKFSKTIERIRKQSMDIAERLNVTTLKTSIKVGPDGKSFGSITSLQIAELLHNEGIEVDKKKIVLEEPVKQTGTYDIKVHLGDGIDASFTLCVEQEHEPVQKEAQKQEQKQEDEQAEEQEGD